MGPKKFGDTGIGYPADRGVSDSQKPTPQQHIELYRIGRFR